MVITCCDICKSVIKPSERKWLVGINPVKEEETLQKRITDYHETAEILVSNTYRHGRCQIFEVCEGCKQVLEYTFRMRKDKLKKLKDKLEKMYDKKAKGEKTGE